MWQLLKLCVSFLIIMILAIGFYIYANKVPDLSVDLLAERWAQPPSTFIEIAGMRVHVRDEGPKDDKLPIVLIHGTSASLHTWDGWSEELSTNRRVIRFDLPAFGLTGPEPSNNYSIERYAEIVIAVLDRYELKTAVLGGNSLGGYIAWATTVLHPQRIAKLVLVDASGYPYESESVPIAFRLSQNPLASSVLKDFLPKFLVARSVKNVYGNPALVSDELVDRYYELSLREGNRSALKERFKQTLPGPMAAQIPTINVPTLIIWGAKDRLIPLKFGQRFNEEIKNSQLLIFEELGHVPHEENPRLTVSALQTFLSQS